MHRYAAYALCIALVACHGAKEPSGADVRERVEVTAMWSIVVPRSFKRRDQGGDWQASDEHRVVFVKSQLVTPPAGGSATLDDLAALGDEWLASEAAGERIVHQGSAVRGQAIVRNTATGYELEGFMATDGSVVVCVIDIDDPQYKSWAIETWKSLNRRRNAPAAGPQNPQ